MRISRTATPYRSHRHTPIQRLEARSAVTARTLALVAIFASTLTSRVALSQPKPLLTAADYGQFEYLTGGTLSPDGRWLSHRIRRVNDTSDLYIRRVTRTAPHVVRWGSAPSFSANSRWAAWAIGVSPDERERMEKEKKPVRLAAGLLELETGRERRFELVQSRAFDPSGRYLALHGYAPDEPKGKGADLRVLRLGSPDELTFGNVAEYAWSAAGSMLAFTVATGAPAGNGVQVYDMNSGRLFSLDASGMTYRGLTWRKDGFDLAVLRSTVPAGEIATRFALLAFSSVGSLRSAARTLDLKSAGVVDTLELTEFLLPRWSRDGKRIAVGLRPVPASVPSADSASRRDTTVKPANDSARTRAVSRDTDLPGVQIWHSRDVLIVPEQQSQAVALGRRTLLAVWDIVTNRVVQVSSDLAESATVLEGFRHGLERQTARYPFGAKFGRPYLDIKSIDLATGARTTVVDSVRYSWDSGAGHYVLWYDGRDYWTHHLRTGKRTNITAGLPTIFADTSFDSPTDVLPAYGVGGWTDDDRAVMLYDQHDVWRVAPDGSRAVRLTRGNEDQVTHRVLPLTGNRPTIDPTASLYLSLHGQSDQKRGFARLLPGKLPERLRFDDKNLFGLTKADSADVYAFQSEGADDSPDVFVAGPRLADATQVTTTNAFQGDYAWTHSELVKFRNDSGTPLQGVLLYPANYDPSRRYPMIVSAYEKQSDELHFYYPPSERSYYNYQAWTQQGYFVLYPDIVFRARDPGVSLLEALRPAVASVVARGLVDSARVGFVGHSWGGYHAAYVATHSTLFAASIAGAPLTDFVSFMGQIHWGLGTPEVDHWETGQARMAVPYWEDPAAHERNSPIHNVQNMTTPLLLAHGNKDGVVEFFQSTELYNFARRAGKQVVLLVYEGEDHGFRKAPNQIDYHRRILEWFGHYLKGEPAPAWITRGIPLEAQEAEKRRVRNGGQAPVR